MKLFSFDSNQIFDYVKKNWKPGRRELIFVSIFVIIFVLGEFSRPIDVPYPEVTYNPAEMAQLLAQYNWNVTLSIIKDYVIDGLELVAAFLVTYLYFNNSGKTSSNAFKWGVTYSAITSFLTMLFWINGDLAYAASSSVVPVSGIELTRWIISDIFMLPVWFISGLLLVGGIYLLFLYKPNLRSLIIGYGVMIVFMFVFRIIYAAAFSGGTINPYTGEVLYDATIAFSLIPLYMALKNTIKVPSLFKQSFLFGGIALGLMIFTYISNLIAGSSIQSYYWSLSQFLSYTLFGFVFFYLQKRNTVSLNETQPQIQAAQ